ncbi:hypothetical protein J3Q64DRAFT_1731899 [Phycomyces blakesleeanus]|uniref:Uncharacterized protein n=1 Tax=Phycomyces blakesleeanus TaxID=4837 RepID=A0ABR3B356_PHYBL
MKITTIIALIFIFTATIGAAPTQHSVQVFDPLPHTSWRAGTVGIMRWQIPSDPDLFYNIHLLKGDTFPPKLVSTLVRWIEADFGYAIVYLPDNTTAGSDYWIGIGQYYSEMTYIHPITVKEYDYRLESTSEYKDLNNDQYHVMLDNIEIWEVLAETE